MSNFKKIPVYSICSLLGADKKEMDLLATGLSQFLKQNPNIIFPHRHDFYQIMYITEGSGQHIIDFVSYPVEAGYFYFLSPGMMHTWHFEGHTEGYIIDFNGSFFQSFLRDEGYLSHFPFFHSFTNIPLLVLDGATQSLILPILIKILAEYEAQSEGYDDMIRAHLMELFIILSRAYIPATATYQSYNNRAIIRAFEKLVDTHHLEKRFPKDYAPLLGITPNYLNEICAETIGKSAGQIIRERILLEAKRLLVHSKSNISEIAYQLNFEDNAYFSRFFKKYTGFSPENFRKHIHD